MVFTIGVWQQTYRMAMESGPAFETRFSGLHTTDVNPIVFLPVDETRLIRYTARRDWVHWPC
jgi:hypothetical protein